MGIVTKTVTICTCDICGENCSLNEDLVVIKVNNGDGRDVGPAYIEGNLVYKQPYGTQDGIICKSCKLKYLKKYVGTLEMELSAPCI